RDAVHREARRVWIRRGAITLVALTFAIGIVALFRLSRAFGLRGTAKLVVRPVAALYALWLGGMGAILARGYDASDPKPFLLLGVAVLLIDIAARAWTAATRNGLGFRVGAAV